MLGCLHSLATCTLWRRPWQSPLGKVCPKSYVLCSEECDHCALRSGESLVDSHKKVNTSTDVVAASGL